MNKLHKLWKQWRCEHYWRPAKVIKRHIYWPDETMGYKVCDYCEKQVRLTMADFYAQFGRLPF